MHRWPLNAAPSILGTTLLGDASIALLTGAPSYPKSTCGAFPTPGRLADSFDREDICQRIPVFHERLVRSAHATSHDPGLPNTLSRLLFHFRVHLDLLILQVCFLSILFCPSFDQRTLMFDYSQTAQFIADWLVIQGGLLLGLCDSVNSRRALALP
jgi:hypothetical protein